MATIGTANYRLEPVLTRVTKFNPNKPWRKHGTWNHEHSQRGPVEVYNALSRVKVAPMGAHGVIIKKAVR